jgi:hypothetical protein
MPTTMDILETSYPESQFPPQTTFMITARALYDGCWAISEPFWQIVVDDRLAANPINGRDPSGMYRIEDGYLIVEPGDTPGGISQDILNDASRWRELFPWLSDPTKLPTGRYPTYVDPNLHPSPGAPATSPAATQSAPATSTAPASQPAICNTANIALLAKIIMSEASIGNAAERTAVGSTVINRMTRNKTDAAGDVSKGYATSQNPTNEITQLAKGLLDGSVKDNTGGATHFYSPRSMPKVGGNTAGVDIRGGTENVTGTQTYMPSWVTQFDYVQVDGVREAYYKFYRANGAGPVR